MNFFVQSMVFSAFFLEISTSSVRGKGSNPFAHHRSAIGNLVKPKPMDKSSRTQAQKPVQNPNSPKKFGCGLDPQIEIQRILNAAPNDYLTILNLKRPLNQNQITNAFRLLSLCIHPDKANGLFGSLEAMQRLSRAYNLLINQLNRHQNQESQKSESIKTTIEDAPRFPTSSMSPSASMETSEENSTFISTRSVVTFAALGAVVVSLGLIVWRKFVSTKSNEKRTNQQHEWNRANANTDTDQDVNEFDDQ